MAAALMADLIVAAAIIIRPTSPAPVPPAQNPDHSSHHTIPYSSVLSSTYTTRVLVWDPSSVRLIRLHYHPPAASCKHAQIYHPHSTSLTRHCCCDFTSSNQLITSCCPRDLVHLLQPSIIHVLPLHNSIISRPIDLAANISISSPHSRLHSSPIPI